MPSRSQGPITQLLSAARARDARARERLWEVVYQELHRIAAGQLAGDQRTVSLQPTALVNEVYLRLIGRDGEPDWTDRRHFFAAAAKAMRRIRLDYARKRRALKRGGAAGATEPQSHEGTQADEARAAARRHPRKPARLPEEGPASFDQDPAQVLALDEALSRLEQVDPRRAEIVLLRFFAGLSVAETAATLGICKRAVYVQWRFAKAWLYRELRRGNTAWCTGAGAGEA